MRNLTNPELLEQAEDTMTPWFGFSEAAHAQIYFTKAAWIYFSEHSSAESKLPALVCQCICLCDFQFIMYENATSMQFLQKCGIDNASTT